MGAKRKATKAQYGNKAAQMAAIASQGAAACANPGFGAGFPEVLAKCKKITLAAAQSGQLPIAPTAPTVNPAYVQPTTPAYNAPTNYGVQPAAVQYGAYTDPVTGYVYQNAVDQNGNINPQIQAQISSDEANFQSQQQSQYQQPAYGGQQGGGSQFIYPFVDPMTGISYPNGQDQNGNQNPAIMAQVQSDEQAASGGGGYGGGQQYGYAEGSGNEVMHIVKMSSPVIGLAAGLGIAFLVNKKVKDFGTKGLIGGMVVGTILGVLVPVLMHKPHVKVASVAVVPTVAAPAAK